MAMQPVALSTAWNSTRHTDGAAMLEEIRDLGFEYAELGHAVRYSLWPGVMQAVERDVIKISSLHNFCPVPLEVLRPSPNCYEFTDARPRLREAAVKATLETIRQAKLCRARAVVLHLGWGGPAGVTAALEKAYERGRIYDRPACRLKINAVKARRKAFPELLGRVLECLKPVAEAAGEAGVKIGVEIREEFEEFPNEEEMDDVLAALPADAAGYWHDFGHAQRKEFLAWHDHAATLRKRAGRLIGVHIHDCAPPARDHQAVGDGEIDFPSLLPTLPDHTILVLELSPRLSREQVLASRQQWNSFAATSASSSASSSRPPS